MSSKEPSVIIGLNAVIVAVTDEVPRILIVRTPNEANDVPPPLPQEASLMALPFGSLDPQRDRTLELGLRNWVERQTGIQPGYVEQLYTFGDRYRDDRERRGGARVISVAYLALVREQKAAGTGQARWLDWYRCFPWEDWRSGKPNVIKETIEPALDLWTRSLLNPSTRRSLRERVDIAFGLRGASWDPERVLERFELLYQAQLVEECSVDARIEERRERLLGHPMAFDHRRILATALGRVRGKLKYRPVVFELLPSTFTLLQLQRVVEALAGIRLHKQNFRRLVEKGGLVVGTGSYDSSAGGRPAELFQFRHEVLRERPAPGVGLPRSSIGT